MIGVTFHPEASLELGEAVGFYQRRLPGLGNDLLAEVEIAIATLQSNSRIGTPYKETGLRRVLLRRFPYAVFYLETEETLWIVAVAHTSRRPDYWKRRRIG